MWLLQVLALLQEVLLCCLLRLHRQDMLIVGWGQMAPWGLVCPAWAPQGAALVPRRTVSWEVALDGLCRCSSPMSSAARCAGDGHLPGPESPV